MDYQAKQKQGWNFGKGKNIEKVNRLMVARNLERVKIGEAQKIVMSLKLFVCDCNGIVITQCTCQNLHLHRTTCEPYCMQIF